MAELTGIEEARERVLGAVPGPLGTEPVPLAQAANRVLANDLVSAHDVPGFANSAMDGYAVRHQDVRGASPREPVSLRLTGESRAGRPARSALGAGEAITISTGAMIPDGADTVVRLEDTDCRDGIAEIRAAPEPGANIRGAGEDIGAGSRVLAAGTTLGPAELGVAASVGADTLPCARRPRVAVVATGDELREPGEPLGPGMIHNSNSYSVPALARAAGAEVEVTTKVADEAAGTRAAIEAALGADLTVVCGGVSVGAHDHVKAALAELGVEQAFWGVALRPGKPTWFGAHDGGLVFGLPGNPVSAMVTFILFARPAIRALQGADPAARRTTALLGAEYVKTAGRAHAARARLEPSERGWVATPMPHQGSHVLTSMLGADALAIIPADAERLAEGERVTVELLDRA